jgi:hypothetical protein
MVSKDSEPCFFCESTLGPRQNHHVFPRKFKTYFNKEIDETVCLCPSCHSKLHEVIKPLERVLNRALNKNSQLRSDILKPFLDEGGFQNALELFKETKVNV